MLEADELRRAVGGANARRDAGTRIAQSPARHFDFALLREDRQAARSACRRSCSSTACSASVSICGLPKPDAMRRHRLRFLDHARGMQQRLRRNAADVQTDAAELRPAVDEHHRQAEVGRAERGRVAARTRAETSSCVVRSAAARCAGAGFGAAGADRAAAAGFSITTVVLQRRQAHRVARGRGNERDHASPWRRGRLSRPSPPARCPRLSPARPSSPCRSRA